MPGENWDTHGPAPINLYGLVTFMAPNLIKLNGLVDSMALCPIKLCGLVTYMAPSLRKGRAPTGKTEAKLTTQTKLAKY